MSTEWTRADHLLAETIEAAGNAPADQAEQAEPPFTEEELNAARARMQAAALLDAWSAAYRQAVANINAAFDRAQQAAAERKKRLDAAEQWLRSQEGADA